MYSCHMGLLLLDGTLDFYMVYCICIYGVKAPQSNIHMKPY